MLRKIDEYPNYSGYIAAIKEGGITDELLNKIINKHLNNAAHTEELYNRYKTREDAVPIFSREPRFKHENEEIEELNNQINNDFFSEIADIAVGYFAGNAAAYKYADDEAEENSAATEAAKQALEDFVTRNNMYDVNMETTKYATICGYAGRLFYIDTEGNERVMPVAPYETIILYENEMTEPFAAIRYYSTTDINDTESWKAEYYDSTSITYYEGQLGSLSQTGETVAHLFDFCPLQGIPRNRELLGDAEKVLALIDEYDKTISDNSNDIEGNTNAHMVFKNVIIDDDAMAKARKSGAFSYNAAQDSDVYYLTKNVDDGFNTHHLDRLEDNIYRFSKTPNLNSDKFGEASGISLKFKITGLEAKCGTFEAKCISADTYMFKLLASSFIKKRVTFDPLQCYTVYKRNFPMDLVNEATVAQSLISAGLPKSVVYGELSFIDDVDYVLDEIEKEKESIPSLMQMLPEDNEDDEDEKDKGNEEEDEQDV